MEKITEKELSRIEHTFDNVTKDITTEIDIKDLLPLINYAENKKLGIAKSLHWAFKLGIKNEKLRLIKKFNKEEKKINERKNKGNDRGSNY